MTDQAVPLPRWVRATKLALTWALALTLGATVRAQAQTDYYNLDRGRPFTVQDAIALERHALEWKLAPMRIHSGRDGRLTFELEPGISWGALPGTQLELVLPIANEPRQGGRHTGLGGIEFSVLHALNVETMQLPGLAVTASAFSPVASDAGARVYPTFGSVATRTTSFGRVHLDASFTVGSRIQAANDRSETDAISRWLVGIAADHTFPLRSLLVGAELVARAPMRVGARAEWRAATGFRYQLGPRVAIDLGMGHSLSSSSEWFFTFGSAMSSGMQRGVGGRR